MITAAKPLHLPILIVIEQLETLRDFEESKLHTSASEAYQEAIYLLENMLEKHTHPRKEQHE